MALHEGAVTSTSTAPWIGGARRRLDAARNRYSTCRRLVASRRLVAKLSLRQQGTEQAEDDCPQVAHSGQRQGRNSSVRRSSSPMTNGVASLLSRSKNASPGFTDWTKSFTSHGDRVVAAGRPDAPTLNSAVGVSRRRSVRAGRRHAPRGCGPRRTRRRSLRRAARCTSRRGPSPCQLSRPATRAPRAAGRRAQS